jgi:hypothetical protein
MRLLGCQSQRAILMRASKQIDRGHLGCCRVCCPESLNCTHKLIEDSRNSCRTAKTQLHWPTLQRDLER